MKKLIFALFVILAISSCRSAYVRHGLKDISVERKRLVEAKNSFNIGDTSQIADILSSFISQRDTLNKYGPGDNLRLITKFVQIRKPLVDYLNNYNSIKKEFAYSFDQLDDLEYDLKAKNVSKEAFSIYMDSEKSANDKLIIKSNLISNSAVREMESYQKIRSSIDSLIFKVKQK